MRFDVQNWGLVCEINHSFSSRASELESEMESGVGDFQVESEFESESKISHEMESNVNLIFLETPDSSIYLK